VTVYLVGAGPGDADLLTIRAARLLASADVVVHDRLISNEVLDLISCTAARYDVGKTPGLSHSQGQINELLIRLARANDRVVRLKGGDPFVFGRGGEEAEALAGAGLEVEIVPGITSAFAGPLLAGIPVTHRGLSHGVTIVTGSTVQGSTVDFGALANSDLTLVVLMGVRRRALIASELLAGGLAPSTPVAVVEWASTDRQRTLRCTLDELGSLDVASPAVLVIGAVAALELGRIQELASSFALSP
jgi:uroporphyrin-III C-methyltransferase